MYRRNGYGKKMPMYPTSYAKQAAYSRHKAQRQALVSARRGYSYVPRTPGGLSVTERKYFDSYLSAQALVAATDWTATELDPATLNTLFVPQEGSAINQRIGRKVCVKKITIRGLIRIPKQANQTATDAAAQCRLIFFIDQQTNGTQAQGEELMAAPGSANAVLCTSTFQSTANFGRFRVLKDKTYMLQNANLAYDGTNLEVQGLQKQFKFTVKFAKPLYIHFNSTNGGSVADIVDNSFHIIGTCSNVADYAPLLYYQCRTIYTDS